MGAGWQVLRMTDNPSLAAQPVHPLLTSYVLAEIAARPALNVIDYLFPRVRVPRIQFQIGTTDGSELVRHDTRRSERAKIRTDDFGWSQETAKTERRTFGTFIDEREVENADPWDMAGRAVLSARAAVEYDSIARVATILNADANFLGTTTAPAAGQEWQTVGGSRAVIRAAIKELELATGVTRREMKVALFGDSWDAAQNDPDLMEKRAFVEGATLPNEAALAAWFDVGEVQRFYALSKATREAAATKLFPDHAVIFVPGTPADLVSLSGGIAWGGHFVYSDGQARRPFFDEWHSSWVYPWEMDDLLRISKTSAAWLVKSPYGA
jgi:hypothetical protein